MDKWLGLYIVRLLAHIMYEGYLNPGVRSALEHVQEGRSCIQAAAVMAAPDLTVRCSLFLSCLVPIQAVQG